MTARDLFKQVKAALREHWVEILILLVGVLALLLHINFKIPYCFVVV